MKTTRPKTAANLDFREMFETAGSDVAPISFKNQSQYVQELDNLSEKINERNEWNDQVAAIKRVMGLVNGGALNHDQFIRDLIKLSTGLISASKNLRSALVKTSCLLVSQLARELGTKFDVMGEMIFPLSSQTSHGTQIIADSCKYAILMISRYCQTKRVFGSLVELSKTKSPSNRLISSESMFIILNHWRKGMIDRNYEVLAQTIQKLLKDSNPEARTFARRASISLFALFPTRKESFLDEIEERIRKQIEEEEESIYQFKETTSPNEENEIHPSTFTEPETSEKELVVQNEMKNDEITKESSTENNDKENEKFEIKPKLSLPKIEIPSETVKNGQDSPSTPVNEVKFINDLNIKLLKTPEIESISSMSARSNESERIVKINQPKLFVEEDQVISDSDFERMINEKLSQCAEQSDTLKLEDILSETTNKTKTEQKTNTKYDNKVEKKSKIQTVNKTINQYQENSVKNSSEYAPNVTLPPPIVKRKPSLSKNYTHPLKRNSSPNKHCKFILPSSNTSRPSLDSQKNKKILKLQDGQEINFLNSINAKVNFGQTSELRDSIKTVVSGLIVCSINDDQKISSNALKLIFELLSVYPANFERFISPIMEVLFNDLTAETPNALNMKQAILRDLQKLFKPSILINASSQQTPSNDLIKFIAVTCANPECNLSDNDLCQRLIDIVLSPKITLVDKVKDVLSSIAKKNQTLFNEVSQKYYNNEIIMQCKSALYCPTTNVPKFDPSNVRIWCGNVFEYVKCLSDAKWIEERSLIYKEISDSAFSTNDYHMVLELIYNITQLKGYESYADFLSPLLKFHREKKITLTVKILDSLIGNIDKNELISTFLSKINPIDPDVTRGAIFYIGQLVRKDKDKHTKVIFSSITNAFSELIKNSNPDIRRFSVMGFVDLHSTYKNEVEEYSKNSLSPVQQKLISLYCSKEQIAI
ncbi:hypothetical protein TRFO_12174 [Tritrichomonas foetus]|uniref:TOG domain-containing protein n=1 Tax=Tritrichomonas foetus TaxID=1144522 RepID=A0A1J4J000_9EUKA|nr:hypothetical protein TRFO_12174 [Tritrichomonas foetus]|eukprot:OHS92982.1 hypothetical protein TRFO_12174 [Tritrichomonas foetus]